ncbi:MAG: type II toxin-antitoxin system prevent-host-death family antitoxin [Treponema sp.]|nr:type II toxin-antitoxin system prevent-host-death family antitoxin [Treponema sp.]
MNININSAKNYFSEMMEEIQNGKDYVIMKQGKPIARIMPVKDNILNRNEIVERLFSYQEKRQ